MHPFFAENRLRIQLQPFPHSDTSYPSKSRCFCLLFRTFFTFLFTKCNRIFVSCFLILFGENRWISAERRCMKIGIKSGMKIEGAYVTDIGQKRVNQDSFLICIAQTDRGPVGMAAVCDGVGGMQRGEEASGTVIRAFDRWFCSEGAGMIREQKPVSAFVRRHWNGILQQENRALCGEGIENRDSMGTTAAAVIAHRQECCVIWAGDTRVYEIRRKGIRRLTKDHTLVQHEADEGKIRPEEMERDSRRNILLQCVGGEGDVRPEFICRTVRRNTVYLVCSDGFRHLVSEDEIRRKVEPAFILGQRALQGGLNDLLQLNLARGECDNISAAALLVR